MTAASEVENLGQGGLEPIRGGGLSPPKLRLSMGQMKNALNTLENFRHAVSASEPIVPALISSPNLHVVEWP